MAGDPLPDTADLDLDDEIAREARQRAVREWNGLGPELQAHYDFAALVERHVQAVRVEMGLPAF